MSSKTITDVNTSFITYISGCHVDARKNPIDYNENDLKNTSKWKKYINKIHKLIIGDKFPSMCLVRKTNNTYYYKSMNNRYRRLVHADSLPMINEQDEMPNIKDHDLDGF